MNRISRNNKVTEILPRNCMTQGFYKDINRYKANDCQRYNFSLIQ
jgi:hypothetical protein